MKYLTLLFWSVIYVVLFVFLQYISEYHFYFLEQNQLFQCSWPYIAEKLAMPGGFSFLLSEWLLQFFILPYAGAAIMAGLLLGVGLGTWFILRTIAPCVPLLFLSLLPVVALLFVFFNFNFHLQGTVSYLLFLPVIYGVIKIVDFRYRLIAEFLAVLFVWFLAGPVFVLSGVVFLIYELLKRETGFYWSFLLVLEVLLIGIVSVRYSFWGELNLAFLPDGYFNSRLKPDSVIYGSWIALPCLILLAWMVRKKEWYSGKLLWIGLGIQFLLLAGVLYWGVPKYRDAKSDKLKKLDYYARTGQWDEILEDCKGPMTNYLYMCYTNMALAEKGQLGDRMFSYDQRGVAGLIISWNRTMSISVMLSDLFYSMGDVASAQRMAFEAGVGEIGDGNPRMLKRLVETNLIFGAYPVAEKYIAILENMPQYRKWASGQRRFLYNDDAVEQDPVLGFKRKGLPLRNSLIQMDGVLNDLYSLAESFPENRAPIEYAGAIYLLGKDLPEFGKMVEKYYGSPVLTDLPLSFQEAIIILFEGNQEEWDRFGVSQAARDRFASFKSQILANKGNSNALPGLMRRSFGDTYWYYYMFK